MTIAETTIGRGARARGRVSPASTKKAGPAFSLTTHPVARTVAGRRGLRRRKVEVGSSSTAGGRAYPSPAIPAAIGLPVQIRQSRNMEMNVSQGIRTAAIFQARTGSPRATAGAAIKEAMGPGVSAGARLTRGYPGQAAG